MKMAYDSYEEMSAYKLDEIASLLRDESSKSVVECHAYCIFNTNNICDYRRVFIGKDGKCGQYSECEWAKKKNEQQKKG